MVKKGYRDPPYHNWMHAFSVSHFCYLLYKNLGLSRYLQYANLSSSVATTSARAAPYYELSSFSRDIEILALFVSCMCHDLDHRGTNNSFQVASVRARKFPSLC